MRERNLKIFFYLLVAILLLGSFAPLGICSVESEHTIYIRADGSVDPPDVPILNTLNTTYTFTDNIIVDAVYGIVVEKDNIVIDGNGHTLTGSNKSNSIGIYLSERENVTIRNLHVKAFYRGIRLSFSSNSSIIGNIITGATYEGVRLFSSSHNRIEGNDLADNYYGVWLLSSSNSNCIDGNNVTANIYDAIRLFSSSNNRIRGNSITSNILNGIMLYILSDNNSICGNNIANNGIGIRVSASSGNLIAHNNFTENAGQVYVEDSSHNIWDDGYASGGNYWSDYSGVDLCAGPYQNETSSDGIGDLPYTIDGNNQDNYPLMNAVFSIPGDINGDFTVNNLDCEIVAYSFGSLPSDPNWNAVADISGDGIVDIFDLAVVAVNFGETG